MIHWLRLTIVHLRFVNLSFWRNPAAAFFGMLFPVMFLTINSLLLGKNEVPIAGHYVTLSTYYVASMSVFAVIMTCFTNLATSILFDRDQGRLKRLRGTPTPVSAYIAARVIFAVIVGMLTSSMCIAIGTTFFDVHPDLNALPLFYGMIALGGATLSALALAVVAAIGNAQAGPAILNAVTFPILFISSVFYPLHEAPKWLTTLAGLLPIRPLAEGVTNAFFSLQVPTHAFIVLAVWGVLGATLAARFFRWQPSR